jgi:hypothetical protein
MDSKIWEQMIGGSPAEIQAEALDAVRYVGARQKELDIGGEGRNTSISLLNEDVAEAGVLSAI